MMVMDYCSHNFDNNNNNSYNDNYHNNIVGNNWRKQQKEKNFQHWKPRSHNNNKSSSFVVGCQQLSWDKKFCALAGVPWKKVVETQKYMHFDKNIIQWNDSAVKEAFCNAKRRFYAEMAGQPCDVKMPDPDTFIDEIDWDNSSVDHELISDLEREPNPSCGSSQNGGGVIIGIPVIPEQYILSPSGWGDDEEAGALEKNWGNTEKWDPQVKNRRGQQVGPRQGCDGLYDHWDVNCVNKGGKDFSSGWEDGNGGHFEPRSNASGSGFRPRNSGVVNRDETSWYGNKRQMNHGYNKKWDHGGNWNTSRYKISRYHQNDGAAQPLLGGYGNLRGNFAHEDRRYVTSQW